MKQLKIVEQIIIVLILAILIPFITIGFIISNISQQSVRNELSSNASIIAQYTAKSVENYIKIGQNELNQAANSIKYIQDTKNKTKYLGEVTKKNKILSNLKIVSSKNLPKEKYSIQDNKLILKSEIDKNHYLLAYLNLNILDKISESYANGRNIAIIDAKAKKTVVANNKNITFEGITENFNFENSDKQQGQFGPHKNTPKIYVKIKEPQWIVIVDTTRAITKKTINKARFKIILALCAAAISIIIMVSLYTYYLYINIRQLFKGITAISKGNYDKKIHLIKSFFTPYETVFIAKEFNYMANKIKISYKDLKQKNIRLQQLGEFRDDLISAISHEFRTPLTSIIGYTSRLLRHDIVLDEETKVKSLKIVKQQAQRLSGMVEDLLVIPQLESFSLNYNIQETDLVDTIARTCEYLVDKDIEFQINIDKNIPYVWADESRLEQIFTNLLGNAIKYSVDKQPIQINAYMENDIPVVSFINKCEKINEDIKKQLFEKFIRVDSKLTRTTRGTGLGLYIVRGLAEGMNIEISLEANENFIITLKFKDYVK